MRKSDTNILAFLEDGEQVLRDGKPTSFHIVEGVEGHETLFIWVLSLIWISIYVGVLLI